MKNAKMLVMTILIIKIVQSIKLNSVQDQSESLQIDSLLQSAYEVGF